MVDVRVVVNLVVRGCHAFKLVVLLVGVEGVLAMVVVVLVMAVVMLVVCGAIQVRGALGSSRGLVVVVIMVIVIVW